LNPLAPNSLSRLTALVSDRLNDLQRQRALAQEQVAWFDREIARVRGETSGQAPAAAPFPAAAAPAPIPAPANRPASAIDQQADEIIERFKQTEPPLRDHVRRGCFVYFFIAFALVGIALLALYAWHQSRAQ